YEDDQVLAFYDITPQAPVHIVVIPKQHIPSPAAVTAQNSAAVAHVFEVIARLAAELSLEDGFRVVSNCGEAAGQTVPHLHFHLLAGRNLGWPPG
ncbi:MAG: HIT domain-containing protein, partial [Oscillospiraceae bacterium]